MIEVTLNKEKLKEDYLAIRAEVKEWEDKIDEYAKENGAYISDQRRRLERGKQEAMDKWRALSDFVGKYLAPQIEVKRGQDKFEVWGKTYIIKQGETEVSLGWRSGKKKEWWAECLDGEGDIKAYRYDTKKELIDMINFGLKTETFTKFVS